MKFLCEQCKAKYQIADDKVVGKTVRMKCRKCGHLIEVRAAITESSVASLPPAAPAGTTPSGHPRPARPAPPRSTPLAQSLAAARPPASKPERVPGALAGAFKSNVQREEEISAPFDMSELSPGDDWYVAVNGVPVGPIRVAEVRRKASLGAVTEDSLVWQEGLDEWRPLRSFPELAMIVREASMTGRASMTPPPTDVRGSLMPPARATSLRPSAPAAQPSVSPRVASPRVAPAPTAPVARNNVVAITSRLATAERLEEPLPNPFAVRAAALASQPVEAQLAPAAGTDTVALAPPAPAVVPVAAQTAASATTTASIGPRASRKGGPPWIVLGMVAMFIAFGITAAILVVPTLTRTPETPQAAATPSAASPVASAATAPLATVAPPAADPVAAPPVAAPTSTTKTAPGAGPPRASGGGTAAVAAASPAAAAPGGRGLDLSGLTGGPRVAPTDELGSDGTRAPGQCLSEGQVQQTIGMHSTAIRRTCWERNPTQKLSANVSVMLTVASDGTAQNVSSSGDDPTVAHCIENDVRNWHFPAMGCSQKIAVPFKFVRQ